MKIHKEKDTFLGGLYTADPPCDAGTLVRALCEGGAVIDRVYYEEDADVGMGYYEGELSAEAFLQQYGWLRGKGMGGMNYTIHGRFEGSPINIGISDDSQGRTYNRILMRVAEEEKIVQMLESSSMK